MMMMIGQYPSAFRPSAFRLAGIPSKNAFGIPHVRHSDRLPVYKTKSPSFQIGSA